MLTNALDIMKFITCPTCKTKNIDTYHIEELQTKNAPNVDSNYVLTSSTNTCNYVHLYLICKCGFKMRILDQTWLDIFQKHAFGN